MTIATINLGQKLSLFADHWAPRIVGQVNDSLVKLVKLEGGRDARLAGGAGDQGEHRLGRGRSAHSA